MATIVRHQDICNIFLNHAEDELRKGDLLQASEKAWGAVAQYVKSVAHMKNWDDGAHYDIHQNAYKLINRTDDPKSNEMLLRSVSALHSNFYEDFFNASTVKGGIEDARELIDAMRVAEPRLPVERRQARTGHRRPKPGR